MKNMEHQPWVYPSYVSNPVHGLGNVYIPPPLEAMVKGAGGNAGTIETILQRPTRA